MYIRPHKTNIGAYPPPQSLHAKGLLFLPDELLAEYIQSSGFVELETDGVTVTRLTPNTEALAAWNAKQQANTPTEAEPVTWSELDAAYLEGRDTAYDG